jgi:hypothetical protein
LVVTAMTDGYSPIDDSWSLGLRFSRPTGVGLCVTVCGRSPPSLPNWIITGPAAPGSGTPPTRVSVGQRAGQPPLIDGCAGSMVTSPESVWSSGEPSAAVWAASLDRA